MQPIPLIHKSALVPAIGILDGIGAPSEEFLRENRLPVEGYEEASGFVSVLDTWAFVDDSARSQGLWDFGFRIADRVTLERASRWGPRTAAAPTLQAAIKAMSDWVGVDLPNVRIGLESRGDSFWLWREHVPDRRAEKGYWVGDQYMIGFMIELIRRAVGEDWYPRRLEVEASASDWGEKRPEIAGDAQIKWNARRTAVELPTRSLGRRLRASPPRIQRGPRNDVIDLPAPDLRGSLHQALRSLAFEEELSIQLGAEIMRTSERSLRRYLKSESTTWRDLVDRVRLECALDLMEDPAISLPEVAARLGYSQYPHFYRAFRRWTKLSPREYRESNLLAR